MKVAICEQCCIELLPYATTGSTFNASPRQHRDIKRQSKTAERATTRRDATRRKHLEQTRPVAVHHKIDRSFRAPATKHELEARKAIQCDGETLYI